MNWQASTGNSCFSIIALQSCFNALRVLLISLILLLGAKIHPCYSSGCHIVALEHDADIFNDVLMPMRDPEPLPAHSTPRALASIPDEPLEKRQRTFDAPL